MKRRPLSHYRAPIAALIVWLMAVFISGVLTGYFGR